MIDPNKAVSDAAAEVQQAEKKAEGFFTMNVPLWAVLAALAVGALLGKLA